MNSKFISILAATTATWLAPSLASAFHGNLVTCHPTAGVQSVAKISPGLTCNDALEKTSVAATGKNGNQVDNCAANGAAPWNAWAAGKIGKITAAGASSISKMDVSLKTTAFGSCLLTGDAISYTASGAGKFQFYTADGVTKIAGGGGSFFATIGQGASLLNLLTRGLVTKGFGVGAAIEIQTSLDLAGPTQCGMTSCNGLLLACNTGAICPPDVFGGGQAPITAIDLITDASSHVTIQIPDNSDCTGAGTPLHCCTGAGTGTC
jgi:hypothetical protein